MKDDDRSHIVFSKESREPPMLINPSDLGDKDVAGQVFTFGVRTKSTEVSVCTQISGYIQYC